MNLESIALGILLLIICIIPFVIISRMNRQKEKKLLQTLFYFAENSKCIPTQYDHWGKSIIGIDEKAKKLFFTRMKNGVDFRQQIDLMEVQNCRVFKGSNNENNYKMTGKIELVLSYKDKTISETYLEFFNSDYDSIILNGEIQLVEKWCKIINSIIQ